MLHRLTRCSEDGCTGLLSFVSERNTYMDRGWEDRCGCISDGLISAGHRLEVPNARRCKSTKSEMHPTQLIRRV